MFAQVQQHLFNKGEQVIQAAEDLQPGMKARCAEALGREGFELRVLLDADPDAFMGSVLLQRETAVPGSGMLVGRREDLKVRVVPLHKYAKSGNLKMIRSLLKRSKSGNALVFSGKDAENGMNALHWALDSPVEQVDVVQLLVQELGMDVNECADSYVSEDSPLIPDTGSIPGATPLTIAIFRGHAQTARQLVALGADVNKCSVGLLTTQRTQTSPLHTAAHLPNDNPNLTPARTLIQLLVRELGAVVDNPCPLSGITPLLRAVQETGAEDNVRMLLELGADPHAVNATDNANALHFAAFKGQLPAFKVLVEAGADLSLRERLGFTPRQVAKRMCSNSTGAAAILRFLDDHVGGSTSAWDFPSCGACDKQPSATDTRLRACKGCLVVCYCSRKCQRMHWKNGHKAECGRLKDVRAATP